MVETDIEEIEEELRQHSGILFMKFIIKCIIIILVAWQFLLIHKFLLLAFLFAVYFTFPGSYRTDRIYSMFEAWARMGIGIFLALYLGLIFWIGPLTANQFLLEYLFFILIFLSIVFLVSVSFMDKISKIVLSILIIFLLLVFSFIMNYFGIRYFDTQLTSIISLVLLVAAFYVVPPERIEAKKENQTIIIIGKKLENVAPYLSGNNYKKISDAIFLALMFTSLFPLLSLAFTASGFSAIFIIMFLLWALSLFTGLSAPIARPYFGILLIGFATLIFSYQYTGVVGTALFGQWWAPIEQGISMVTEPLSGVWSSINQQMHCLQILISNPALYSTTPGCGAPMPPPSQAVGSTRAIEITEFQAVNYATGEQNINPQIPLIGSAIIENAGEFTANNIKVTLGEIKIKDPSKVSAAHPEEGYYPLSNYWGDQDNENDCIFETCTGGKKSDDNKLCEWEEQEGIFPGYKALLTFKCGAPPDYKNWNVNYTCWDEKGNEVSCNGSYKYKTYKGAGYFVSIPIEYEFNYVANASLPVEIMNSSVFQRKLLAKEITLEEKQTKYTGGPVEIGIWTQKQPIRSGETSYGKLIIKNNGEGTIKSLSAELELGLGQEIPISNINIISGDCEKLEGSAIKMKNLENLKSQESAICTFSYIVEISDNNIERKSTIYTATVNYNYSTTYNVELQISNAPIQ
ncbi:MAG: hypothetical protein QXO19_00940 [Candidatus Aenigmatarchaeota archaeon]